ncbi:MAG: hypothetical protein R3E79_03590 [Caldilineaceae bacterium]
MEIGSLLAPKLHTITDTCQFLDGNPAAGAFRKVYDLFADAVVLIFGVALFLLGKIAQYTLCRLRSFALQTATLAATTLAHTEHGSAIVTVAVTIKGDSDDARIDAKPFIGIEPFGFWYVASLMDVPFALAVYQVGFTLSVLQHVKLSLPCMIAHFCSTTAVHIETT